MTEIGCGSPPSSASKRTEVFSCNSVDYESTEVISSSKFRVLPTSFFVLGESRFKNSKVTGVPNCNAISAGTPSKMRSVMDSLLTLIVYKDSLKPYILMK